MLLFVKFVLIFLRLPMKNHRFNETKSLTVNKINFVEILHFTKNML